MGDALIGTQFAGYRIEARVGRGGMGVVYRATDLTLERTVALKLLAGDLADDPAFRGRFTTESKLAASLDHPNVIPIHAAGECDGVLYIAMRFVAGHDLQTILRAAGPLPPPRAARIVAQVAAALDAAHARGLVHRDVKPANVLLTDEDHAYLTDFGLSKRLAADGAHTRTGEVLGTLDYLAPEQIRHQALSPATDVYALGCLTFHLLTGGVPYAMDSEEAKLWAHLSDPPPRPSAAVPALGTAFDRVVIRAMRKRPDERFTTAGELAGALADAVETAREHRETRSTPVPRPVARPSDAAAGADPDPAAAAGAAAPPAPAGSSPLRRDLLLAALADPFDLVVLAALLATGVALGTPLLMAPLAALVYALATAISYRSAATARRATALRARS